MKEIGRYKGVDRQLWQQGMDQVTQKHTEAKGAMREAQLGGGAGDVQSTPDTRQAHRPGDVARQARPGLAGYSSDQIRTAEAEVKKMGAVFEPLKALIQELGERPMNLEGMKADQLDHLDKYMGRLLVNIERFKAALDAAGPAVADLFPATQLEALEEAAKVDTAKIQKELKDPAVVAARRKAELAEMIRRREMSQRARGGDRVGGGGFFRREPEPIPEATALNLSKLPDTDATTKALVQTLRDPGLEGVIAQALEKVPKTKRKAFEANLKGFAMLSDFATTSLDYARTGVAMFGHPKCRRTHQARKYGRLGGESEARQRESRADLAGDLKAALTAAKPADALAKLHTQAFLREVGVPDHVAANFDAKPAAVTKALQDELFVPLRALNETIADGRYRGPLGRQLQGKVQEVTQAVVEGRFADWRLEAPESKAQVSHLDEGQLATWLGTEPRKTKLDGGATLTTREAEGHELFWATKVGGPSHAFDTMNWCVLSLLGNARTKAIVLEDSDWHQVAARAYLRLFKDPDGNPMVYLDPTQIDFPHREHHGNKRRAIESAMLQHGLAKAKAMGAGLVVTSGPWELRDAGLDAGPLRTPLVLEPNRMIIEASDTLGRGHDWPQPDRDVVHPGRCSFVSAEEVAKWAG